MRAVMITAPRDYAVITKPVPSIGPEEFLLAPLAVGICRTDLELLDGTLVYFRDGRSSLPLTPGHEWVARVAAVGSAVDGFSVGQRVVGETSIGCGSCPVCARGDYHQCPERRETGVMNLDGAMGGFFAFPARAAHAVPDHIGDEDAVFAEPAAVALRAILRSGLASGDRSLVVGGGTIGWLTAAIALDLYEVGVAIAEPDPVRRARLESLGARTAAAGDRFDVVIEASGSAGGIATAFASLADSGRLVAVGLTGLPAVEVDLDRVVVKDQTLIGSLGSPGVWPETLRLLGRGRVKPSSIVTRRHPLSGFLDAVSSLRDGTSGGGKVLILPSEDDRA
jgi:threonine dehydrogenase-like Zn-dependent dehydrogenase